MAKQNKWQPDEQFLEFMLAEFQAETGANQNAVLMDEAYGKSPYTVKDVIDDMRQGTQYGRHCYNGFFNEPHYQARFKQWKAEQAKKGDE